jgi:hypothetical protein
MERRFPGTQYADVDPKLTAALSKLPAGSSAWT